MSRKTSFWYKVSALLLVLTMIVPILAACGGDDEEETITPAVTTPAATTPVKTTPAATTPAATTPAATLPFVNNPVKIALIIDWSGPSAMAGWLADGVISFADWYWNEKQGGIQVGNVRRPVEFLKYDNKGQVADAAAAAKKALLDGVVAITMGGVSGPFYYAVADVTDPENVLYVTPCGMAVARNYKWVVSSFANTDIKAKVAANLIVGRLKAKTVGLWGANLETERSFLAETKKEIIALDPDIKFVYEEYPAVGSTDYSPYLTAIKYKNPDVLLTCLTAGAYETLAKQIMELGGWGDIKHVSYTEAANLSGMEKSPGAQGWYVPKFSLPGVEETPGQIRFTEAWAEKCKEDPGWCKKYSPGGSAPLPNHAMVYSSIPVAIRAIELAGTDDRAKVAQAARSGKLELDSPLGYMKIGPDGTSNLSGFYAQLVDGKFVSCK